MKDIFTKEILLKAKEDWTNHSNDFLHHTHFGLCHYFFALYKMYTEDTMSLIKDVAPHLIIYNGYLDKIGRPDVRLEVIRRALKIYYSEK